MNNFKKLFILIALTVIFLPACQPAKPGMWHNDMIPADIRVDFDKRNHAIFDALNSNRPDLVENMLSKDLLTLDADRHIQDLLTPHTHSGHFKVLDEWYVIGNTGDFKTFNSAKHNGNAYHLDTGLPAPEVYVSCLIPDESADRYVITVVYGKFDYGWRINSLGIGRYTVNGKTAPQWFQVGQAKFKHHYFADAGFYDAGLYKACQNPNPMWTYNMDTKMSTFFTMATDTAQKIYTYPYPIYGVNTEPMIFNVFCNEVAEGSYPMIYYFTHIDLKNTIALKQENDEIKKVIGKVLPGIDKDKKVILFEAYNKPTSVYHTVPSVDFRYELK